MIFAQMTPGGMIGGYCEDEFPLYFANYEMVKLLGYDSYDEFAEAIEWKVENTIHPDDRLAIVSACTDISEPMEVQRKLKEDNAELLKRSSVRIVEEKEQELWLASEKLESILRQAAINCWVWDIEQGIVTVSNVVENRPLRELFPIMGEREAKIENAPDSIMQSIRTPDKFRPRIVNYIQEIYRARNHERHQCEFPIIGKGSESIWLHISCETLCNEKDKPVRAVGYYMDVTEQKKAYLRSKEDSDGESVMIMFDMDNFKVANDVFGHAYGDAIISKSAEKLRRVFREDDIVCRIGGDEFLILCKNIKEDIERKLEEVIEAMKVSCKKGGREIIFTASAGYATIPDQGVEFDELYRKADIALFTSKMNGKGTFRKYNSSMKEIRYELADKKRKTLSRGKSLLNF